MFGRQNIDDTEEQEPLDDAQAPYVAELTGDLDESDSMELPDLTPPQSLGGNQFNVQKAIGDGDYTNAPFIKPSVPAPTPPLSLPTSAPLPTTSDNTDSTSPNTGVSHDELLDLKHQALSELSPLVGHLQQSPEETFRTTMMLIQASDNASLIRQAYSAAQAITDDKVRAQALLDVVNEINYFTSDKHVNNK